MHTLGPQLAGADVGLFYYAGHGVQVRGENYLIPVDANPTKEADVDFQMLDTNLVLRQMEGAGTRLNIVILDACRNNPFGAPAGPRAADGGPRADAGPGGHPDLLCHPAGSVAQDGSRRQQPLYEGARGHRSASRASASSRRSTRSAWRLSAPQGGAAALGVVLADRRRVLFRRAVSRCHIAPGTAIAPPPEPNLAPSLRPDPALDSDQGHRAAA